MILDPHPGFWLMSYGGKEKGEITKIEREILRENIKKEGKMTKQYLTLSK
jgi:hypothetical protein